MNFERKVVLNILTVGELAGICPRHPLLSLSKILHHDRRTIAPPLEISAI